MSSQQGDDLESQPSSGPGAKLDGAPSLTTSTNDVEYGYHRNDGEDLELKAAELSEQGPAESTGGKYRARVGGSVNTGGGCTAKDRDSKFIAVKLTSMIEGIIQQTQATMEGFMSNISSEIDSSSLEVMEELQNAKDWGDDRKFKLEEEREKVRKAVCRVLEVLNVTNPMMDTDRAQMQPDSDDGDP